MFSRAIIFVMKVFLGTFVVFITSGVFLMIFLAFIVVFFSAAASQSTSSVTKYSEEVLYGKEDARHVFVSIPINGTIVGDESDVGDPVGLFTQAVTYGYTIKKQLRDLTEDTSVAGIILDVNSPGGTIYGAKAIADGVSYYKEKTGKPVVTFVSGLAASGAYWAAVSSDEVIAPEGTTVGSIGVISGPFKFYDGVVSEDSGAFSGGVVTEKGIDTTYITAGKSKDLGNPYRKMTTEEIAALQKMVNSEYDSFVSYVSGRRNIPTATIKDQFGALVYDAAEALQNKMIDLVGSREDAYAELAHRAHIPEGNYMVVRKNPIKGLLRNLLAAKLMSNLAPQAHSCLFDRTNLVYYGDVSALCF